MLAIGDEATDFELPDQRGTLVRLHDELARGSVVLFFYPADFTPVCTAQACMVRDRRHELAQAGFGVVGISPQSGDSHGRFDDRHALGITLLADEGRGVARAYGVLGPFGMMVRRVSYLIGTDAIVRDREVADLRVSRHERFIDRVLAGGSSRGAAVHGKQRPPSP